MRTALLLALLGAFVAVSYASCPYVSYYHCVKDYKPTKCKAIEVCEHGYKEKCGHEYCEYPYTCASLKKKECSKYLALKDKCGYKKKVCKDVKYPCGYGYCSYYQDCVKDTKCYVYKGGYRKLLGDKNEAKATAVAINTSHGSSHAHANAYAGSKPYYYGKPVGYKKVLPYYKHGRVHSDCYGYGGCKGLVCKDEYKCVAKAPCKDVIIKKCVKSHYKPGYDRCHGGHNFKWYGGYKHGDKCGHEHCGDGYKCAEVYYQECKKKCGDSYCDYGHECAYDDYHEDECKDYAYLDTICKEYHEDVCVLVPGYLRIKYKAPCKTVYKCDYSESYCGSKYCGYGYVCAVSYKKVCGASYYPKYYTKVYEVPHYYDYKSKPYYPHYTSDGYYGGGYYPDHHYKGGYYPGYSGYGGYGYGGDGGYHGGYYGGHGGYGGYGGHGGHSTAYAHGHADRYGTHGTSGAYQYGRGTARGKTLVINKKKKSAVYTDSRAHVGKRSKNAEAKAVVYNGGHGTASGHSVAGAY